MFTEPEIKKFQSLSEEMAKLIEDPDGSSNEASVAYGKIGRVCANVLSRHAAMEAKKTTRAGHVDKFKASRQSRAEKIKAKKGGSAGSASTASAGAQTGSSQRSRSA